MFNSIFEKKNAIYELDEKNGLPFEKTDVKIKANQLVTSSTINAVLNNLVENDLYTENLIEAVADSKNIPGAQVTQTRDTVLQSSENEKFIIPGNSSTNTFLGKRKMGKIENSLSSVPELDGLNINFLTTDGNNYIAGTNNGLYTSYNRFSGWRLLNEHDYLQNSFLGNNCITLIENNIKCNNNLDKYAFFLATDDGIFAFFLNDLNSYWFKLFDIKNVTQLKLNPIDKKLYIATNNGLYWTTGNGIILCNNTSNLEINDICILNDPDLDDSNRMLIGTNFGIRQSANGKYFSNIELLYEFGTSILSTHINESDGKLSVFLNNNDVYEYDFEKKSIVVISDDITIENTTSFISDENDNLSCVLEYNAEGINTIISSIISVDNNGLQYFALSSENPNLTFQTERLVSEIIEYSSNEYVFNDGVVLSVFNSDKKEWTVIESGYINSLNLKYPYPIKNLQKYENTLIMSIGSNLIKFDLFEDSQKFISPFNKYSILNSKFYNTNVKKIFSIDDNNFIIGTSFDIKYIKNLNMCLNMLDSNENIIEGESKLVFSVNTADIDSQKHIFVSNNTIYNTFNNINANIELKKLNDEITINNIFIEGNLVYNICTNNGLFTTEIEYELENELNKYSLSLINNDISSTLVDPYLENHINEYHTFSEQSEVNNKLRGEFIVELDKKCKVSVDKIPENFTSVSPIKVFNSLEVIKNDVVESVEFNDSNSYIRACINNWVKDANSSVNAVATYSNNDFIDNFQIDDINFDLSKIPYIYKKWKSGLKEINIFVPSTLSFYINNPKGFGNSIYNDSDIIRKNISDSYKTSNIIFEKSTNLRLLLNNTHFKFTNISNIQIVGNSLPLKIYKDDTYFQAGRENLFDTIIQPSIVNTLPTISSQDVNNINALLDEFNNIILDFSCYGTDAQSIRILGE